MTLTTYAGQVASLQEEAFNNTQITTARCARFIEQGEIKLRRRLRVRQMLQRADFIVGSDTDDDDADAFFALDAAFLAMKSIEITIEDQDEPGTLQYLDPIDLAAKAADDDTRGKPTHYTLSDGEARLWPVPDQQYTVRAYFYAAPTALSDATQTNLFTSRFSDALFYYACAAMSAFLRNWDDADRYLSAAETAVQEALAEEERDTQTANESSRLARLSADDGFLQTFNRGVFRTDTCV